MVGTAQEPDRAFLPWEIPLESWPEDLVVALPRGISRHIVRFVRLNGIVYAIKETEFELVKREYYLLGELQRRAVPCVDNKALAIFTPLSLSVFLEFATKPHPVRLSQNQGKSDKKPFAERCFVHPIRIWRAQVFRRQSRICAQDRAVFRYNLDELDKNPPSRSTSVGLSQELGKSARDR